MRSLVALIALVLLAACTRTKPVSIQANMRSAPDVPFKIYSEGQPVNVTVSGDDLNRNWSFSVTGTLRGDQLVLPQYTLRMHLPCGWREFPLPLNSIWTPADIRERVDQHETLPIDVVPPEAPDPEMSIDIDNRGGGVHTLEVGEMSYPVPAGKLVSVGTYQPMCAKAVLKLDGNTIGSVPAPTKVLDPMTHGDAYGSSPYVFIDPTAKRCYQVRAVNYSTGLLGDLSFVQETLRGKRLYVLGPHPRYVLEPAPKVIYTQHPGDTRYELTEKNCR